MQTQRLDAASTGWHTPMHHHSMHTGQGKHASQHICNHPGVAQGTSTSPVQSLDGINR